MSFFFEDAESLRLMPFNNKRRGWSCAFRRLLSDGCAVVRFEVGFHIPPASLAAGVPMLNTLATMLETPCTLRGERDAGKLLLIGKRLARLYARATAPKGTRLKSDEVIAGQPTMLVQFEDGEGAVMPRSLDFGSDRLAFMKSAHGGVSMNPTIEPASPPPMTRLSTVGLAVLTDAFSMIMAFVGTHTDVPVRSARYRCHDL